ncbi:hypothetical protein [Bacillus cereus]|nr:hypothetical protein [Bacillus cereus]
MSSTDMDTFRLLEEYYQYCLPSFSCNALICLAYILAKMLAVRQTEDEN